MRLKGRQKTRENIFWGGKREKRLIASIEYLKVNKNTYITKEKRVKNNLLKCKISIDK